MPLVENGRIVEDRYVRVLDDAPVPDRVPVLLPAKQFIADANELVRRDGSLGVLWPNDCRVAELEPWLGHLALIALNFPKFRDGRAYSQARLLREHFGFRGTLRATGDVLRDQFHFLVRAGFNSFEVKKLADAQVFAEVLGALQRGLSAGSRWSRGGVAPAFAKRYQSSEARTGVNCRYRPMPSINRFQTAMFNLVLQTRTL